MRFRRIRRCDTHDRAVPLKIAQLEADTGINPDAVADMMSDPDSYGGLSAVFSNPDLIDCGKEWCRKGRTRPA